nr:M56 family metallopeptidase [Streptomyces scabichelini]
MPGHRPRVIVSAGALRLLSAGQLDAVLAHERAYIAGRHHLVLAASEAFTRVFGRLPPARHAKEQTAMLLEMIPDDRALRRQPREVLAAAMYDMAAGTAPVGALAVSGPSALIRLRRALAALPPSSGHSPRPRRPRPTRPPATARPRTTAPPADAPAPPSSSPTPSSASRTSGARPDRIRTTAPG